MTGVTSPRESLPDARRPGITFFVADYSGPIASTRPKGAMVASHITRLGANCDLLEINFKDVEVASAPFMQEVVRAARLLGDGAIYSCLSEDVHATLTFVENRA